MLIKQNIKINCIMGQFRFLKVVLLIYIYIFKKATGCGKRNVCENQENKKNSNADLPEGTSRIILCFLLILKLLFMERKFLF